jgi:hypothetical protein
MKRNDTDDSEVARRVERIFDEIDYSVAESVDESKLMTSHSSADASSNAPGGGSLDDGGEMGCGESSGATSRADAMIRPGNVKVVKPLCCFGGEQPLMIK